VWRSASSAGTAEPVSRNCPGASTASTARHGAAVNAADAWILMQEKLAYECRKSRASDAGKIGLLMQ